MLYSANVWNLYENLIVEGFSCYLWSLWCFIALLNYKYDKFYFFKIGLMYLMTNWTDILDDKLDWCTWWQIGLMYLMTNWADVLDDKLDWCTWWQIGLMYLMTNWTDVLDDKLNILWLYYQKWIIWILSEWMNETVDQDMLKMLVEISCRWDVRLLLKEQ